MNTCIMKKWTIHRLRKRVEAKGGRLHVGGAWVGDRHRGYTVTGLAPRPYTAKTLLELAEYYDISMHQA